MPDPSEGRTPLRLGAAVGLVAAAMLLLEIMLTRLFSVLFFYHYSFFAVSLIMSGLAIGGVLAARWDVRSMPEERFRGRLGALAAAFALAILAALAILTATTFQGMNWVPSMGSVLLLALAFLPGMVAGGAFLAAAFAREPSHVGALYAFDLVLAAAACLGAIAITRAVQGPAMVCAPALLAAAAGLTLAARSGFPRAASALLALAAVAGIAANAATGGRFPRLRTGDDPLYEKWNEHSRVIVRDHDARLKEGRRARMIVIDNTAVTFTPKVRGRGPGEPVPAEPWWDAPIPYVAYRIGRPLDRVAIIGVGGGRDLLAPLANGARRIDGFELNGILVDLQKTVFSDYDPVASWQEVNLVHGEGRVGIRHSGGDYDVIQASMIDTWAATASGGLVLSENGLYTVEAWETFLGALSDTGVLTMTRWFLEELPTETLRLLVLATTALEKAGVRDVRPHVILVAQDRSDERLDDLTSSVHRSTILVSKAAFTPEEVARVRRLCDESGFVIVAAPGEERPAPLIDRILTAGERDRVVAESPFDISAPTDLRPYFFLQVRPSSFLKLLGAEFSFLTEMTFNAVRILVLLVLVALGLTILVLFLAARGRSAAPATPEAAGVYRRMIPYFVGTGVGYILVQLGFLQRLILVLGHPITAFSVVLFAMLLGTGLGSALSARLFPDARVGRAFLAILAVLAVLAAGARSFSLIENVASTAGRGAIAGTIVGLAGLVLGFAFPIGVRIVAPTGERAVQTMWALNGAATIAGSALAALLGLTLGSQALFVAGGACYVVVALAGRAGARLAFGPAPAARSGPAGAAVTASTASAPAGSRPRRTRR